MHLSQQETNFQDPPGAADDSFSDPFRRKSMRNLMIFVVTILLASCVAAPKTVSEFRQVMQNRPAFMKEESHVINRELSVIERDLGRKSKECLQFGYSTSTRSGASARNNTVVYHPHIRTNGKNKAELFIQEERTPQPVGAPKGGAYIFLADLKQITSSKTQMILYGPSFPTWQPIFDAIKGWSEGKNIKCPDSP